MVADTALQTVPSPATGARATVTATALERALAVVLAVVAIGFGAATVAPALAELSVLDPFWGPAVAAAVFASLLFVGATAAFRRAALAGQVVMAVVFAVALVTWPAVARGPLPHGEVPWLWWLCNVGTIAASIAFRTWRAAAYSVLVPVMYAILRVTPSGGAASVGRAVLDGVYVLILGGTVLVIIVVLRRTAATVDAAQATAVSRYASASRAHATEVERVQVDAIVHDSVLTTLLSAARAEDVAAQTLAASMATNALHHLESASADVRVDAPAVPVSVLWENVRWAVSELAAEVDIRSCRVDDRSVPATVADALASAALQAAVNSVQHAGGPTVSRWVEFMLAGERGVRVEVGDDGAGFDVSAVPAERLGVRRSILERVAAVGGAAEVSSSPGHGTRIVLTWTDSEDMADADVDGATAPELGDRP